MRPEWDDDKAAANHRKHRIDFADAVTVLDDERAITMDDEFSAEERFITLGMDALGRLRVVVYTWRDADTVRLISARRATTQERRTYEK